MLGNKPYDHLRMSPLNWEQKKKRRFVQISTPADLLYLQIAQKLQLFWNQKKQGTSFCTFSTGCTANPMNVLLKVAIPTYINAHMNQMTLKQTLKICETEKLRKEPWVHQEDHTALSSPT